MKSIFWEKIKGLVNYSGEALLLFLTSLRQITKKPFELKEIVNQFYLIGVKSAFIVSLTNFFIGMVLALQTSYSLERFGAKTFVPKILAVSLVREIAPILTALIIAGRSGSGISSELSSMKVTEQIDAIRCLGANPLKKLVAPRILALFLVLPTLTILGIFVGLIGGMIVSIQELGITASTYQHNIFESLELRDFMSGVGKTFFFGLIIAIIGCYQGMSVQGGTKEVGIATTESVVYSMILILISNYFITKVFILF
ncbi:ABC transporter permease [bacterium]|nr:ABC transporter permease [bacterium]